MTLTEFHEVSQSRPKRAQFSTIRTGSVLAAVLLALPAAAALQGQTVVRIETPMPPPK